MGCDIHSVIQVKSRWRDGWRMVAADIGDGRDYNTFAVYADVRNAVGFAGSDTGERWKPISEPRGFPDGFVETVRAEEDAAGNVAFQWMGDHSQSWLLPSNCNVSATNGTRAILLARSFATTRSSEKHRTSCIRQARQPKFCKAIPLSYGFIARRDASASMR